MTKLDRRKGGDRRETERYRVELGVAWESSSGRWPGTMSDVSSAGCFILGPGEVEDGDQVCIDVPLHIGGTVELWGKVVNHIHEIGFGVKFVSLTDSQQNYLFRFTDTLRSD